MSKEERGNERWREREEKGKSVTAIIHRCTCTPCLVGGLAYSLENNEVTSQQKIKSNLKHS